jgi:hypothetical protein
LEKYKKAAQLTWAVFLPTVAEWFALMGAADFLFVYEKHRTLPKVKYPVLYFTRKAKGKREGVGC